MKELLKIASNLLKIYFSKFPIQQMLRVREKGVYASKTEYVLPVRDFIPYMQRLQQKNSEAEINCQISSLLQEIKCETNNIPIRKIIDFFSDCMINRFHDDYRFSFEYCDVWRETIVLVDEETFVISKMIQENQRRGLSHISNYSWPNCIEHDNLTISSILNSGEGVSDNHFHLRASSPYYQFSWIKMMNFLIDDTINRNLELIDEKRLTQLSYYTSGHQGEKLSILHIKATAIRIYLTLYILFEGDESKISNHFVSANIERILLLDIIPLDLLYELQRTVDYLHFHFETYDNTDYIGSLDSDEPLGELYGERKLISSCLMLCDKYIDSLLCVYLAIKNHFRMEIIQSNGLIGFNNFYQFQERKGWFIPWSRESEKKLTTATISDVIYGPRLNSLELRIVPASLYKPDTDLIAENIKEIDNYDAAIKEAIKEKSQYTIENFYYTFHFSKLKDEDDFEKCCYCRHHKLRSLIDKQAESILKMRDNDFQIAKRVRGIDACNEEIECRPEVFGTVYRRLQYHDANTQLPQLQATFHVGEDNYDIVDGLRAIHEALLFLKLRSGSRLGHATMLGISVRKFYEEKEMRISMPLQNYVDNLAWIYYFVLHNYYYFKSYSSILEYINSMYLKAISKLYECDNSYETPNIDDYTQAWLLRGDEPSLYEDFKNEPTVCSINSYLLCDSIPEMKSYREKPNIRKIYYRYHYDKKVRLNGQKAISVPIINEMLEIIEIIQKALQNLISEKGIGIECNPTSNLFISTINGYQEHPVKEMFDKGLNNMLPHKNQICASINTDDKSVFSTTISNEYAYLAYGMMQIKDDMLRKVYSISEINEWIELLKKNGNSQVFSNWDSKGSPNVVKHQGEED